MNTILTERFIHRPEILAVSLGGLIDPGTVQLPLLAATALLASVLLTFTSSMTTWIVLAVFLLGWIATSILALMNFGLWLDMVSPVLGTGVAAVIVFARRSRHSDRVRSMFETYLDPAVVATLTEDEGLAKELGGQERHITSFVANVTDFTGHCEVLNPEQVSSLLTDYLTPMTEIVLASGGTRDKFIGDELLAFYGAPLSTPQHALKAVGAAIDLQERLVFLKQKWRADEVRWYEKLLSAGRDLEVRIGLHTGNAKVGNFGSVTSKSYTVLGDTVNLALRLEKANKEYGTRIIASGETLAALEAEILSRPLDHISIKGRVPPFVAHEVIGRIGAVAAYWPELLTHYNAGVELYRQREFSRAKGLFERALSLRPGDGPCLVYIERCSTFLRMPPPENWNGSITMTLR